MLRTLKSRLAFFVVGLFVVSSASVFADTVNFQWEDTTSEVPGSEFSLTLEGSGQDWVATLTVNTALATFPGWYINYITLHLDGGQSPLVSNFLFNGLAPPDDTNWNAFLGGDEVDLLKKMHFPQNSWVGLYTDGIVDGGNNIAEGVPLDNGTATWTFDLLLAGGSVLNESPSIQVGYFSGWYNGGGKYKVKFTQMSQTAGPEPGTLLLVGSGLLGGAFFRKRLKQ